MVRGAASLLTAALVLRYIRLGVLLGVWNVVKLIATVVTAAAIGFGVPAGWVWVGSQVEGGSGASSVSFTAAVVVLIGIIVTYGFLLYLAGWAQSKLIHDEGPAAAKARYPWMESLSAERHRPGSSGLRPLERVFVTTTLLVNVAFVIWFFGFAGSPLPGG